MPPTAPVTTKYRVSSFRIEAQTTRARIASIASTKIPTRSCLRRASSVSHKVPSFRKPAATTFYGDACQAFTEIDYEERDIEVAFGYEPSILLLRADNGAEICRFPGTGFNEYLILNLAKLPPQVTIRAKWDMGRGVEGNDQVLPGTSVRFIFASDFGVPNVENVAPFAIGGDDKKGTYFDFSDTLRQLIGYGPDPRGVNGLTVEAFQDDSNLYAYESVYVSFSVIEEPLLYRPPACSTARL